MSDQSSKQMGLDGVAAGLSSLCLAHCLMLPVLLAFLPMLGGLSDAFHGPEWLHWALLAFAAPFSVYALRRGVENHGNRIFWLIAIVGFVTMAAGAMMHDHKISETLLTVVGGIIVAGAHWLNWKARYSA